MGSYIYEMGEGWEWREEWPSKLDTGTVRALKEESGWCNIAKTKIRFGKEERLAGSVQCPAVGGEVYGENKRSASDGWKVNSWMWGRKGR